MKVFIKQVINKGWKNLVMTIALGAILLGHVQQANAQNIVVDEIAETKYDSLTLDPNISIIENYSKICHLVSLRRMNEYAKNFIVVKGHYVGNHNNSYDFLIGKIYIDRHNYYKVGDINLGDIIDVLSNLYSHSLDKKFQVASYECDSIKVGNGYFYSLYLDSNLYKKINDRVTILLKNSQDATKNKKKKKRNDDMYIFGNLATYTHNLNSF